MLWLVGTIILLLDRDDKPVPKWTIRTRAVVETKITINDVLSIFPTILKSTVMIPIATSVSQLKWLWFHRGKNMLSDVQHFKAADRGPLGSIILL